MPSLQYFICHFKDPQAFHEYLLEKHERGIEIETVEDELKFDELPENKFCEDQGEDYFDDSFFEGGFSGDYIKNNMKVGSYVETYADKVIEVYDKTDFPMKPNSIMILFDQGCLASPKTIQCDDYMVFYLGTFEYKGKYDK
ncbi:MAG: immunity 22 family protein [Planctomycetes bacterium]|nr:immunity 22 family protein [Planctomycetota bacterium]